MKAPETWAQFGTRGEGIVVANIDSGVNYLSNALVNNYRGNTGGGTFDHSYDWWDPYNHSTAPIDYPGQPHGSGTMGVIAGGELGGVDIGVAPGAKWIACAGFDPVTGGATDAGLLECAQYMIGPWQITDTASGHPTADPTLRPHVVNNSWGSSLYNACDPWYYDAVQAWRDAGVFPEFSAGNDGHNGCATSQDPASYDISFATGAIDQNGVVIFHAGWWGSARGPRLDNQPYCSATQIYPDVMAPGEGYNSVGYPGANAVQSFGGTSGAGPHVTGAVALIWSANPNLSRDIAATENILRMSATSVWDDTCGFRLCKQRPEGDVSQANNVYGYGNLDILAAVRLALSYDVTWLAETPQTGSIVPGGSQTVKVAFDATGLTEGTYTATLVVIHNDPLTGRVSIPVTLHVYQIRKVYLPLAVK